MRSLRRFLAIQRALAVAFLLAFLTARKAQASNTWAKTATWTPEAKPKPEDEIEIGVGFTVTVSAAAEARSLACPGTITGISNLSLGDGTAPASGVIIEVTGTDTRTGQLILRSTAEGTQEINVTPAVSWSGLTIEKAPTKYKLGKDLSLPSSSTVTVAAAKGALNTNGKKLEVGQFGAKEAEPAVNIAGSTVRFTGTGPVWQLAASATFISTASTVEITDTSTVEKQFIGNGTGYATVTIPGNFVKVEGANTYSTAFNVSGKSKPGEAKGTVTALSNHLVITSGEAALSVGAEVVLTGVPVGTTLKAKIEAGLWEMSANATETVVVAELVTVYAVGVLFQKTTTQTVTALSFNGTTEEPNRIASTEAGKQATIKVPAGNVEHTQKVRIKDIAITGGDRYFPNGVDLGGNNEHVHFTVAPGGGEFVKKLEAGLSFTGGVGRATAHQMSAGLSFAGILPRGILHQLTASLSFAGSVGRAIVHSLAAGVSFAGSLPRSTVHRLVAELPFSGALPRRITRALPAGLSFTGALGRNTTHTQTAGLSFTGGVGRSTTHQLAAGLSFKGTLGRAVTRGFSAVLSFVGVLSPQEIGHFVQRLTASLSFQGSLPSTIRHQLNGSLSFAGALPRVVAKSLGASLSFLGRLPRNITRQQPASLSFQGILNRNTTRQLPASLSFSGAVPRTTRRTLKAVLAPAATLQRTIIKPFSASLPFEGRLGRSIVKRLQAAIEFVGRLAVENRGHPGSVTLSDTPRAYVAMGDTGIATVALTDVGTHSVELSDSPYDVA